jgi:phosphopantothenoylcysteine decarboxylase/phosphopantothenate--cysteine ligase
MGGDENAITLVREDGAERWPRMAKARVAADLAAAIARALT